MSHGISIVKTIDWVGFEIQPALKPYECALLELDTCTAALSAEMVQCPDHTSWHLDALNSSASSVDREVRRKAEHVVRVLGKYGVYAEITD